MVARYFASAYISVCQGGGHLDPSKLDIQRCGAAMMVPALDMGGESGVPDLVSAVRLATGGFPFGCVTVQLFRLIAVLYQPSRA